MFIRKATGNESLNAFHFKRTLDSTVTCIQNMRLLDPLYVANEGKLAAIVSAEIAERLVARMKRNVYGAEACIIGEVKAQPQGIVAMRTGFGGTRIVDMLAGEQLPRIC